jgi:hypothetical protein
MIVGIILVVVALVALFVVLGPLKTYRDKQKATSIEGNGLATPGDGNTAEQNLIGPVVLMPDGQRVNKSVGCPPTLLPLAGAIGYLDIPQSPIKGLSPVPNPIDGSPQYEEPDGHFHYCTTNTPIPPGAKGMDVTFRIEAAETAEVRPRTGPSLPSMISLYTQRRGEDFSGTGEKVYFRWFTEPTLIWQEGHGWHNRGEFTISVPFDVDHWFEEDSENAGIPNDPARRRQFFAAMLSDCQLIGFVCGGGDGKGHGIFAHNGPVRLVLVSRRFT